MGSPKAAADVAGDIRPALTGLSGLVLAACAGALSLLGLGFAEAFDPAGGLEALQVAETGWLALSGVGLFAGVALVLLHPLGLILGGQPARAPAPARPAFSAASAPPLIGALRPGRGPGSPRASPL